MRRYLAVALSFVLINLANAQVKDFELNLEPGNITPSPYARINTTQLDDNKLLTIIIDTTSIAYFKHGMKDDQPTVHSYTFDQEFTSLLNFTNTANGMAFLMESEVGNRFLLTHDTKTNEWKKGDKYKKKGEKFVSTLTLNNTIYNLHLKKNKEELTLYSLKDSTFELAHTIAIGELNFNGKSAAEWIKQNKKVRLINSSSPNELFASRKAVKLYHFGDRLAFTFDDKSDSTAVLNLDLKTNIAKLNTYTGAFECDKNQLNYSSLTENYLVKVNGCKQAVTLSIRDLSTKKIIKKESIVYGSILSINNWDNIIGTNKKAESIDRMKTKQLIQNLLTREGSLYVQENGKTLNILVGNISPKYKARLNKVAEKQNKIANKKGNGKGSGNGNGGGLGGGKGLRNQQLKALNLDKSNSLSRSYGSYLTAQPRYLLVNLDLKTKKFNTSESVMNHFEMARSKQVFPTASWIVLKENIWLGREGFQLLLFKPLQ